MNPQSLQFAQETARRLQQFGERLHGLASVQCEGFEDSFALRVEFFASDTERDGSGDLLRLFEHAQDLGLIGDCDEPIAVTRGAFGPAEHFTLS